MLTCLHKNCQLTLSGVAVEKLNARTDLVRAGEVLLSFFSSCISGASLWCRRSASEANQSLEVLCRRCQEELLPNELESAQAQAAQPDVILQFREQGFYFLPLPLCLGK